MNIRFTDLRSVVLFLAIMLGAPGVQAQVPGGDLPPTDTTILFRPVRPLLEDVTNQAVAYHQAGMSLLLSSSGWAVGGYYGTEIGTGLTLGCDMFISGKRNTDEFDNALYNGLIPVVADKVNRLFVMPLTISLQYRLFRETLQETFRPFLTFGAVAGTILKTPYLRIENIDYYETLRYYEFFESFGHATTYLRPGAMIGLGAVFGPVGKGSQVGVSIRYFTIPFGGKGLESILDKPITDFGGLVIGLAIGTAW